MSKYNNKDGRTKRNTKPTRSKGRNTNGSDMDTRSNNHKEGVNDISWYAKHPELLKSVSMIPFAYQPGREVPLGDIWAFRDATHSGEVHINNMDYDYPGIIALSFTPTVGQSADVQSPINIASKEMYAKIRANYSGSLEADSPDLMMYMLALDSLYMLYEDYKRAYYMLNNYTYNNHMFPKKLVAAMGYDHGELQARKTEFFTFLTEAAAKLNKFLVPDFMPIFNRHSFMAANVYTDYPTAKSQLYLFRTAAYYQLTNADTQSKLVCTFRQYELGEGLMRLDDIKDEFNSAIDALFEWDTAFTINGYFQRAYGEGKFLQPAPVIYDGVLNPVYNELVLAQIQNASVNEIVAATNNVSYTVEDNCLHCRPIYSARAVGIPGGHFGAAFAQKKIFTLPGSEQPSEAMIVEASRLSNTTSPGFDVSDWLDNYIECGTEIITRMTVYTGRRGVSEDLHITSSDMVWYASETAESLAVFFGVCSRLLSTLSSFRGCPTIRIFGHGALSATGADMHTPITICGAENLTTINDTDMANLHRVCIYSEFNCFN